jgi:hypothetical protein
MFIPFNLSADHGACHLEVRTGALIVMQASEEIFVRSPMLKPIRARSRGLWNCPLGRYPALARQQTFARPGELGFPIPVGCDDFPGAIGQQLLHSHVCVVGALVVAGTSRPELTGGCVTDNVTAANLYHVYYKNTRYKTFPRAC